ncbi:S-adenosyl-L-methionine-dependent methyltransferase [Phialemonium atrogriseum]|uniref:S-adenosyl-L-methionine-dependent methyltransferase n=1 Tax=Phialemonium atrogriseum TaxID=1093897 RepID=A0AAJ0C2W3_9PEZI|nr:S-adenosyl-L-methionine-dependent methyltransferase [Phialemonium atrogriseum]KAK1768108.1 S-adenosyl-L-methionine-dependent methyltransferase [Phialemonium atrogriseum]
MSQNIYDQQDFFEKYSELPRSVKGLDGAPEWPHLQSFLPDLTGLRVLDLGCGFGWFVRWAKEHGAETVHGVDISQNMLDRARGMTEDGKHDGITYQRADLDELRLPEGDRGSYDVVFSSLAFHYLEHLPELVGKVHGALKPKGRLVFSVEHPIFTAPSTQGMQVNPETGRKYWPLDDYQKEGLRVTNWLANGVRKQHRTLATYINILLSAGFELTDFHEWHPSPEELAEHPSWDTEIVKPTFLLIGATKK